MQFFWRLVSVSFRQETTYRTAMWAGLATNLFFGLLKAALITALYAGKGEVNALSFGGAITFVGLTQALIAFHRLFGSTDLMTTVYSGQVATDLLRPVGLYPFWMARELGRSLFNLMGRGILYMVFFRMFFPLQFPCSLLQWMTFMISVSLAWFVSFSWNFLVNLVSFWTTDGRGVARIAYTLSQFLSGFIMPLALLPDWFSRLCSWTPFPAIVNTPVEVYLGMHHGSELIWLLVLQVVWFLVLAGVGHLVLQAGLRRLVIQGG